MNTTSFIAIDFETADSHPASACAVALVQVHNGTIVRKGCSLIRPERPSAFTFEYLHGITQAATMSAPDRQETVEWLDRWTAHCDFFAAHNARFDAEVLRTVLGRPAGPWLCTVELARAVWGLYPTTLSLVCARLGIDLHHHDPLSDAQACAQIILRALQEMPRLSLTPYLLPGSAS